MCPVCAARVDEVTTMKGVLQHAYAKVGSSESLRLRIIAALGEASVDPGRTPRSRWFKHLNRLIVPVAMAAGLVFAVIIWPSIDDYRPRPGSITVIAGRVVADVRAQHIECLQGNVGQHHAADLPRDVVGIGRALSRELKLRVLAPDLRSFGFHLAGADRCGLRGHPGAHVLYKALGQDVYVSIFTVGRLPDIVTTSKRGALKFFVSDDGPLAVLGWHSGRQSYLICGDLPKADLQGFADHIRFAVTDTPGLTNPVLARRNGD